MGVALEAFRGDSPRIVALRAQVEQLLARQTGARRLPPILILGETGTGKGLLASAIHQAGPRRERPFVAVNCAAIPETLLEAELFGYERGAFTDARQAKPGLFQTAHGGTLFLDEIGLLPAALQGKLLTVLEDRAVRRLGSTRAEPVDVALVAATSVELKQAIGEGRFREDLYHRLAVISLELPPLRARGRDILRLADYFLTRACADYGLPARALTDDARDLLVGYRWPGNVRELANALERVVLLSVTDEITAGMLDFLVTTPADVADVSAPTDPGALDGALRGHVEAALKANAGNIRRTAAALGISRNTLRARMDRYGLRHAEAVRSAPSRPLPPPEGLGRTEWERRHLAFLRARLLPSSTVDVNSALEAATEKVRSFGGRVEDSGPTGLMAVFGLEPVDNAPSHAALAALAIQTAAARARGRVDVVIGIDCDHHVVRRQGATVTIAVDGKAATWPILEELVKGDRSGAIVVTDAVVPFLTRRFVLERLGAAWGVLRRETAPVSGTRFVGRSSELAILRDASARAEQSHGRIVSIIGEAGVGKTRLLHEAARLLQGWRVVSSGGAPYATNAPYFPLAEALKSLCRVQDTDTAAEVRERVARSLPPGAGDPDRLVPPLLDVLGVLPPNDAFRTVDPAPRRQRTHDALRQVFVAASVAQPLCLIVEDLHWIDVETQTVLDRLVDSIPAARVLLVVNYRPEYQHRWSNKTHYVQLGLDVLAAESAGELLDALLGEDPGLAPLKQLLADHGNPFFLEETVQTLVETKALEGARGRYRLTQPVQAIEVPPTVQAILAARIDRLPPAEKALLQCAAVIGKDVPFALLQEVADTPGDALRAGLTHLVATEFVYETSLFPDLEYTFKHALTHDVAYGGLLHERRRALHERVVTAIERICSERPDDQVERLAHHALRAERWEKAAQYARRAGAKAAAQSAYRAAVERFEEALAALARLPETTQVLMEITDVHLELRTPLFNLGEFDRILPHVREAERIARQLGDARRRAIAANWLSAKHWDMGELSEAREWAEVTLALANSLDDEPLRGMGHYNIGRALLAAGQYRRAIESFRSGTDATGDYRAYARAWTCWALAGLGEFEEAFAEGRRGVEMAMRPPVLVQMCQSLGRGLLVKGDVETAAPVLGRGLAVAEEYDLTLLLHLARIVFGYMRALRGDADEACDIVERSLKALRGMYATGWVLWGAEVGGTFVLAGRHDDAIAFAEDLIVLARRVGAAGPEASALQFLGDAVAATGDGGDGAAAQSYRHALALAEALSMRPLAAHGHAGLARLAFRAGRRADAGEHLATATAMYRGMGMTYWLEKLARDTSAFA